MRLLSFMIICGVIDMAQFKAHQYLLMLAFCKSHCTAFFEALRCAYCILVEATNNILFFIAAHLIALLRIYDHGQTQNRRIESRLRVKRFEEFENISYATPHFSIHNNLPGNAVIHRMFRIIKNELLCLRERLHSFELADIFRSCSTAITFSYLRVSLCYRTPLRFEDVCENTQQMSLSLIDLRWV